MQMYGIMYLIVGLHTGRSASNFPPRSVCENDTGMLLSCVASTKSRSNIAGRLRRSLCHTVARQPRSQNAFKLPRCNSRLETSHQAANVSSRRINIDQSLKGLVTHLTHDNVLVGLPLLPAGFEATLESDGRFHPVGYPDIIHVNVRAASGPESGDDYHMMFSTLHNALAFGGWISPTESKPTYKGV